MSVIEELHLLVDMLPEAELQTASRFLHFLAEGGFYDPMTDDNWEAVRKGDAEVARGEVVSLQGLKAELGL